MGADKRPSKVKGAGLLCPGCLCARLKALGLTVVRCTIDVEELMPRWKPL